MESSVCVIHSSGWVGGAFPVVHGSYGGWQMWCHLILPRHHVQMQKPQNTKPRTLETGNLAKIFNQVILSLPLKWLWYAF